MNVRRVLGTLITAALLTTILPPLPAVAAPLLAVITVDPSVSGSQGATGTAPFDATSYVPPNTNAGTDSSATDHVVRTNDLITYDFQYSVNNAPGVNITLTSTLGTSGGLPVADWAAIPSQCTSSSTISPDKQTLTCVVGAVASGSALDVVASAKVRVSAGNGATIEPSVTVDDPGSAGTIPATSTGYYIDQSHPSATVQDTITAVAKFNAMKQSTVAKPIVETYTYFGDGGVQGYYVDYPILVREGNGSAGGKVGITTAPSPITITDHLTPGLNATLATSNACGVNGSGFTFANEPYGAIGINGSTAANAVVNSGTITCTQVAAGGDVTITITGADTSGSSYPVNKAGSAGIDNLTYVVAGYLRLFVRDTGGNLGAAGTGNVFSDTYTGIDPGDADETAAQLTASVTLTAQGPAPASGSMGKIFRSNTAEQYNFPASNSNGPALTPGQQLVSIFAVSNTSTTATGLADLDSVVACDTIDTAHVLVYPFDGSTGAVDTLWGGAVHLSTVGGGSFSDASPPAGFTVRYGDATSAANCSGATGFYTSATDPVFTAGNPIVRVRFTANVLTASPQQQLRIDLNEKVNTPLAAGTIVSNTVNATATSSTGGPGYTGGAYTQGQIFTTAVGFAKYIFKDTSGTAVFNANGAQPPSANNGRSSGSQGLVDTNQQIVAALDDDGTQGTLPSNNIVACDIVPANLSIKDFDGTTGTANGSPVAFQTIGGSAPATPVVQYSTVATVPGDTCLDDANFSSTEPAVRSTITRVRATYTLPANSRERMLINFQVGPAVAPHTVITNAAVTQTGADTTTRQTASETATVEPETVQVTKSTTTPTVTAGSQGSFTIQGYVQGPGTPASGVITVTDTLPSGLTYVPSSTVLTNPPSPTSYVSGSASATPVITTNGGGQQVLTWTLGTATANPGVFIQLPTLQFSVNTDISLPGGSVLNSVTIADTADGNPSGPNHTATASITISNPGAFHITKVTPTPQIPVNGTITWQLNYANTGATSSAVTDIIDVLPYNGDTRGTVYHGTLTLATAAGTNGETITYTKATPSQINEDPGCTSNGGVVSPPTGGCAAVAATVWCPALSGGTCPASLSQVTGVRATTSAPLPANSGTRTVTLTATTNANIFTDQYWNTFGARTTILGLGVHSQPVETIVPIPPSPFVTLIKSCLAPATCITAPQAPGTDITYAINATNTGGHVAGSLVITDPMPPNMDFKLGSATGTFQGGITVSVSYSSDGITYGTYTPVSGGGGAATGYDRNVKGVRWTLSTSLPTIGPANTGTVQFTAAIQ